MVRRFTRCEALVSVLAAVALAATARPAASASTTARPAKPATVSAAAADSLTRSYAKDREDTKAWLKSGGTSYLATILRRDFEDRATLTLGRATGSDVRIDD